MSDIIFLEALEIEGIIGIYDWERTTKQTIRLDLQMPANASRASGSDDISDTLNYKDIAKRIISYVEGTEFQLIETLVERVAAIILDEFKVSWVDVSVSKPGAIRGSKNVGIRIRRGVTDDKGQHDVYLALGSNIEPKRHLKTALELLVKHYGSLRQSTVYQNKAVGFQGDDFLNMVVGFRTRHSLDALRQTITDIEDVCGRVRGAEKFAPRTLDIDMLMFGDTVITSGPTLLPRPEILKFPFMLRPLAELAGDLRHPTLDYTLAQLWTELRDDTKDGHAMRPVDLDSDE
ncbi:MAG: 2-amino-4-hydroxy-6-hydroxymethyldihydropteridine diphosphokinase [Pseudomonadota bacterium]